MPHTRKNQSVQNFTIPNKVVVPEKPLPAPHNVSVSDGKAVQQSVATPSQHTPNKTINWWVVGGGGLFIGLIFAIVVLISGLIFIYTSNTMLPGTTVFGTEIGGMSQEAASAEIANTVATGMVISNGQQEWRIEAASLGIQIDADATATKAYDAGRDQFFVTLFGHVDIAPVLDLDVVEMRAGLESLAPQVNTPAVNAGVTLVNGQVEPRSAQVGWTLDVDATIAAVQQDADAVLADGKLELVMRPTQPTITDTSGLVAQATQLLSSPLQLNAFDPVRNESVNWTVAPEIWSTWLEASGNSTNGTLTLKLASSPVNAYLEQQSAALGATRFLNIEDALSDIQQAVAAGITSANVRIYHTETTHQVATGDTFWSLAYNYGIPYGWLVAANPDAGDALSIGQTIIIPSPDDLLPLPIVYNKRIVVSISQQRMWAYENGEVKWEWLVSTGIADSPTAPGVFQIQSHYENAYAGNWDLWMPYFMGIYQPVPNLDFMNGFHGFPTRGGYQLLWTNSLGTQVTYGCILLSDENIRLLYDWAEKGVVVEIQP